MAHLLDMLRWDLICARLTIIESKVSYLLDLRVEMALSLLKTKLLLIPSPLLFPRYQRAGLQRDLLVTTISPPLRTTDYELSL